jgi:signal recognition particle subunit SEC65
MNQATKIDRERKVRKDFNVSLITAKTIEALLRFLELEPNENPKSLDLKLNQHRIEIQGQKPNRIKKQLKNTNLQDYIQEENPGDDHDMDGDDDLRRGSTILKSQAKQQLHPKKKATE